MSFSDWLRLSEAFSISRDGIIACDGPALSCSVELLLSAKLTTLAKRLAVPPVVSVPWEQPCCCCTIWFPPASKHHSKSWLNQAYDRLCCGSVNLYNSHAGFMCNGDSKGFQTLRTTHTLWHSINPFSTEQNTATLHGCKIPHQNISILLPVLQP